MAIEDIRDFVTIDHSFTKGSLSGHFLAASPAMDDPIFKRSFILICADDEDGTFGVKIDKSIRLITSNEIYGKLGTPHPKNVVKQSFPVYDGGPVDSDNLIVVAFEKKIKANFNTNPRFIIYGNTELYLKDFMEGVIVEHEFILCQGYCAWIPGQLEDELRDNSWIIIPPDYKKIFTGKPERRWNEALKTMKLNDKRGFVNYAGSA